MEIPSKNRIDILYDRNKEHYTCAQLPDDVDIAFKDFKIENPGNPSEYFRVDIPHLENPRISKMDDLLVDDEIIADPGVYCWVLGEITNPGETHIYAKKSGTIQEIQSKHANIVREVMLSDEVKGVHECGFKILYAGELRVEINKRGLVSLEFNFLSGTFMADREDIIKGHVADAIDITLYYFATIFKTNRIKYDGSYKTFVTRKMTKDDILNYMALGANIYRFSTEEAFKESSRLDRKKLNEIIKQQQLLGIINYRNTSQEDKAKFQQELEQSQQRYYELMHYHDQFLLTHASAVGFGKKKSKNNRTKKTKNNRKIPRKNKKSKKVRR